MGIYTTSTEQNFIEDNIEENTPYKNEEMTKELEDKEKG